MDGNIQVTEEFDIFVEFCFKHGGTLRNHKQFSEMARVLKQKISDMHERLLTPRAPDAVRCPECKSRNIINDGFVVVCLSCGTHTAQRR